MAEHSLCRQQMALVIPFGLGKVQRMKAAIFDYNRTLFDPEVGRLFPGVIEILEKLKAKLKLALVAKGDAEREKQIEQLGLRKYFEVVIVGEEKDEEDYRKCIEQMNVEPSDVYVIGDRVAKEIRFGNAIGAVTVWFRNGKFRDELPKGKEEKPAITITALEELQKLV